MTRIDGWVDGGPQSGKFHCLFLLPQNSKFSKMTLISNYFFKGNPFNKEKAKNCLFLRILSFDKGITAEQVKLKTQELRGASLGSFQTFWSPFPRRSTFSSKSSIFQNNEYFRYLPSFRGSYVAKKERQGKNNFPG